MRTVVRPGRVFCFPLAAVLAVACLTSEARAVTSAELATAASYQYGRFEARVRFAFGDGVISSFFLWKDGSEKSSVFWNELDFEKLRANCEMETNAIYGDPETLHTQVYSGKLDLCGSFHTYAYEWTPDSIVWFIDGTEIRREGGAIAAAYRDNAKGGMQFHFNIWPGNESFGGNFDPKILPLYQYINWVQYSSYTDGKFQLAWREDFTENRVPSGWNTGTWDSPKGLSTHSTANVTFVNGFAVLSLTADNATGASGVNPTDPGGAAMPAPTGSGTSKPAPSTNGSAMPSMAVSGAAASGSSMGGAPSGAASTARPVGSVSPAASSSGVSSGVPAATTTPTPTPGGPGTNPPSAMTSVMAPAPVLSSASPPVGAMSVAAPSGSGSALAGTPVGGAPVSGGATTTNDSSCQTIPGTHVAWGWTAVVGGLALIGARRRDTGRRSTVR